MKLDMLSQHVKCRQSIPAYIAKVTVYKGLLEPWTADKLWESDEPNTEELAEPTLQHFWKLGKAQGMRHKTAAAGKEL